MKKLMFLVALLIMIMPVGVSAASQKDYVDAQTTKIINELNIKDADAYHKVLAINDYMFEHFNFVQTRTNDNAYTLLNKGESNCQGFCQLFIELTKKVDLESAMVYQDYMGHRWNVVKMDDGKYYFVDVATNRYMNNKRMYTLKGTKDIYYTMNSTFKYNVPEANYKYNTSKPTNPSFETTESQNQATVNTEPTQNKPQTSTIVTPQNGSNGSGANAGITSHLFSFSKTLPNYGNALNSVYNFALSIKIPIVFK